MPTKGLNLIYSTLVATKKRLNERRYKSKYDHTLKQKRRNNLRLVRI
jgi:hypothetical protein